MPEISEEDLKKFQDAQTERDSWKTRAEKAESDLKAKPAPKDGKSKAGDQGDDDDEDDLAEKARLQRKESDDAKSKQRSLEGSVQFNMGIAEFMKTNSDLLTSDVVDVVAAANKETYDTQVEKASAVRAAVIKNFFSVQANVDLLTPSQKTTLDDYLKLTLGGRKEKAEFVYENLFEPALELLKRIKKAEELGKARSGHGSPNKVQEGYIERLKELGKKTYLGEKGK